MTPQERLFEIEKALSFIAMHGEGDKMIYDYGFYPSDKAKEALTYITALKPLFDSMYDSLIAADIVFNAYVDAINGEMTASELASLHDATQEKIKQTLDEMKDALQEKMK